MTKLFALCALTFLQSACSSSTTTYNNGVLDPCAPYAHVATPDTVGPGYVDMDHHFTGSEDGGYPRPGDWCCQVMNGVPDGCCSLNSSATPACPSN